MYRVHMALISTQFYEEIGYGSLFVVQIWNHHNVHRFHLSKFFR